MSAIGHTMASMTRGGKAAAADDSSMQRHQPSRTSSYTNNSNSGGLTNRDRGKNISHLMSFTLPPRLAPPSAAASGTARRSRRGVANHVPFNKERYVNAQYRFLVKPTGDYTAYFADSDIYLHWADILTVLIPTSSALSTASHVTAQTALQQPDHERHEGASCPICLSPPTAPRMTKCGHVFCFPCILHYLTVEETVSASGSSTPSAYHQHVPGANRPAKTATVNHAAAPKWKRCPICWDAVYAKDLKAVQWWDAKAQAEEFEREEDLKMPSREKGDYLCMRLIERPFLTTLALPQSSTWPNASTSSSDQPLIAQHSAPWHFQPDVMTFCKFMLASPDQLLSNLSSNLTELGEERQLLQSFGTKDDIGIYFVELAERKVQEQMEKVMNELDTQTVQSRIGFTKNEMREHDELIKGLKQRDAEAISKRERKRRDRERRDDALSTDADRAEEQDNVADFLYVQTQSQGGNTGSPMLDGQQYSEEGDRASSRRDHRSSGMKARRNLNPPAPSSSSYLFFQASSGQNIFLHPLDIKIMLAVYGSYSSFPQTLQLPIQGADEGSMNEEMKKRCKYLTHLTKGTDIVFVEVDWEGVVKEAGANGMNVQRETIQVYEQALKQRRNRRRDRERREDRAKAKWEETEKAARPVGAGRTSMEVMHHSSRSSNAEDLFPQSFGSSSTTSPSFRQAALVGAEQDFPIHPGASAAASEEYPIATPAEQDRLRQVVDIPSSRSAIPSGNGSTRTVWGTPAARSGSFASALHNSSRGANGGAADDDAPDWDAWLELEEDFIVGARNGTSVREGRGLNRQAKKGSSSAADSSSDGVKGEESAAPTASKPKQQKKKKIVLTSGGGGRGR